MKALKCSLWFYYLFSFIFEKIQDTTVVKQKSESQSGFKKTKHAKFSKKLTFLTPDEHKFGKFLENLACFCFLVITSA